VSPKIADKFSPAWWLRGPHAQTLWSQYFRRLRIPEMTLERLETPDGDRVHLYHRDVGTDRPRVFLLHGLEGSVRSHYVQGFVRGSEQRGWNTTLLVFRGCGPEFNTAPRMYHSGETSDLRFALSTLSKRYPRQSVALAGVSLGGNVLLKYLGEDPASVPGVVLTSAAVSVPYDLEAGSRHLQKGFARVYDRHFLKSLRRKALLKLEQHPGLFSRERAIGARTIEAFDDAVTGPVHGFAGSNDYYTRSSSIHFLGRIAVPTLLLSAEDDPFLPVEVLKRVQRVASANPNLRVEFTPHGGHVGFLSGNIPFRPVHWAEERVLSFFDTFLK
jgi:predicted alpha/beta-fold hydrolase